MLHVTVAVTPVSKPKAAALCLIVACIASTVPALHSHGEEPSPAAGYDFRDRITTAFPLEGEIQLDGELSEGDWQNCDPITEFLQRDPEEGEPASQRTEVRILFSPRALYVGVICHDEEPERIVARKLRREESEDDDLIFEDDSFHILLDPVF